ncbi:hypothetical protein H922_03850, partial [Citrobacter freundii GTC 09629]
MTNRSDRLIGSVEILHQLNDIWIQSKIFRSTPAGDQQSVVIGGPRLGKIRIQRKTMPRLFTVCLRPIKIVNGGLNVVTLTFLRTDGIGNDSNLLIVFYVQIMPD